MKDYGEDVDNVMLGCAHKDVPFKDEAWGVTRKMIEDFRFAIRDIEELLDMPVKYVTL